MSDHDTWNMFAAHAPISLSQAMAAAGMGDDLTHALQLHQIGVDTRLFDAHARLCADWADALLAESKKRERPDELPYTPKVIAYDGEGDPYWEFVERDCAVAGGIPFAANVVELRDFNGQLVGFRIYLPAEPTPPQPDDDGARPVGFIVDGPNGPEIVSEAGVTK